MTRETLEKAIVLKKEMQNIDYVLYEIKAGEKLTVNGYDIALLREEIRRLFTEAKARLEAELEKL